MGSTTPTSGHLLTCWTAETVGAVTGGNKGIGFAIVRKLALEGITVVLTARDEGRGMKATNDLHAEGLKNVVFHKLDVKSTESVTEFVDWIKYTYGGLDILVNNASVTYWPEDNVYDHAVETIDINYHGTVNLTEKLLPLLKPSPAGARIVNVSSSAGHLKVIPNESLRQQLVDSSKFDQKTLDGCAKKFLDSCQTGQMEDYSTGLFYPAYFFSKVLVNAYTRLLAQRVAVRPEGKKIYVNCVHPGLVDTDMVRAFSSDEKLCAKVMSLGFSFINTEESADTPVWLALMPAGGPSGLFWYCREEYSYYG